MDQELSGAVGDTRVLRTGILELDPCASWRTRWQQLQERRNPSCWSLLGFLLNERLSGPLGAMQCAAVAGRTTPM